MIRMGELLRSILVCLRSLDEFVEAGVEHYWSLNLLIRILDGPLK